MNTQTTNRSSLLKGDSNGGESSSPVDHQIAPDWRRELVERKMSAKLQGHSHASTATTASTTLTTGVKAVTTTSILNHSVTSSRLTNTTNSTTTTTALASAETTNNNSSWSRQPLQKQERILTTLTVATDRNLEPDSSRGKSVEPFGPVVAVLGSNSNSSRNNNSGSGNSNISGKSSNLENGSSSFRATPVATTTIGKVEIDDSRANIAAPDSVRSSASKLRSCSDQQSFYHQHQPQQQRNNSGTRSCINNSATDNIGVCGGGGVGNSTNDAASDDDANSRSSSALCYSGTTPIAVVNSRPSLPTTEGELFSVGRVEAHERLPKYSATSSGSVIAGGVKTQSTMVAAQELLCEMTEEGVTLRKDGEAPAGFDPSEEELKYGPGIVRKLRSRFMSYTMRLNSNKGQRPSMQHMMRRATSLNNLLDDDDNLPQEAAAPMTATEMTAPVIAGANVGVARNGHYSAANGVSGGVQEMTITNTAGGLQKYQSEMQRSRQLSRGNDSLKRARSVETLRYDNKCWERDVASNDRVVDSLMDHKTNGVSIEEKIVQARERGDAKPARLKSYMEDTERPPPDLVKTTLRKFEANANRRGRAPTCRNGEVAAKVATFKSIISEKPAIMYPKPPLSPKKPIIKPRTGIVGVKASAGIKDNSNASNGASAAPITVNPSVKQIIVQPNVIQRSPSPLTIRVDMSYRRSGTNLILSPNNSTCSPSSMSPSGAIGQQTPDLINNISPHKKSPCMEGSHQYNHLQLNGNGGYESPITQLTNKLKSMQLQSPKSGVVGRAAFNHGQQQPHHQQVGATPATAVTSGPVAAASSSTSTASSSTTSSPVPSHGSYYFLGNSEAVHRDDDQHDLTLTDSVDASEAIYYGDHGGEEADSMEDDADDVDEAAVTVRRVTKLDLENISAAATTQEFKFHAANSTPLKCTSHLPVLNGGDRQRQGLQSPDSMRLISNNGCVGGMSDAKDAAPVPPLKTSDLRVKLSNYNLPKRGVGGGGSGLEQKSTTTAGLSVNSNSNCNNKSNHNNNNVKEVVLVEADGDNTGTASTTSLLIRQLKEEAEQMQQHQQKLNGGLSMALAAPQPTTIPPHHQSPAVNRDNLVSMQNLKKVSSENSNHSNGDLVLNQNIINNKNHNNNHPSGNSVGVVKHREQEKNLINRIGKGGITNNNNDAAVQKGNSAGDANAATPSATVTPLTVSGLRKKSWQEEQQTNTMVFNFSQRKDVPDYIDNDGVILLPRKRELPKPGESGYVVLGDLSLETSTDPDDSWTMGPPSPCNVEFENDNVIINGKSNLRKKVSGSKWSIRFDDSLTSTFEYLSETSYLETLEDDETSNAQQTSSNGYFNDAGLQNSTHNTGQKFMTLNSAPLGSYTPVKGAIHTNFELGITRSPSTTTNSSSPSPTQSLEGKGGDVTDQPRTASNKNGADSGAQHMALDSDSLQYLKPATDDQTVAWSEGTRATDLLF